jgi:hypothetical protein
MQGQKLVHFLLEVEVPPGLRLARLLLLCLRRECRPLTLESEVAGLFAHPVGKQLVQRAAQRVVRVREAVADTALVQVQVHFVEKIALYKRSKTKQNKTKQNKTLLVMNTYINKQFNQ